MHILPLKKLRYYAKRLGIPDCTTKKRLMLQKELNKVLHNEKITNISKTTAKHFNKTHKKMEKSDKQEMDSSTDEENDDKTAF